MLKSFLEGLSCPRCTGPLRLVTEEDAEEISTGVLHCPLCPAAFDIEGPMTWAFPVPVKRERLRVKGRFVKEAAEEESDEGWNTEE